MSPTHHVLGRFKSARQIVRDTEHRLPTFSIAHCISSSYIQFCPLPMAVAMSYWHTVVSLSVDSQVRMKERKTNIRSVVFRTVPSVRPVVIPLMHLGIQDYRCRVVFLAPFCSTGPIYFDNVIVVNLPFSLSASFSFLSTNSHLFEEEEKEDAYLYRNELLLLLL